MRILYVMHVDWRWIKQRPQFLAEQLSCHYSVRVLDRRSPFEKGGRILKQTGLAPTPLLPLPWSWPGIRIATNQLQRGYLASILRTFRPEVIWLTYPALLSFIPRIAMKVPIVYDCMDDVFGFRGSSSKRLLLSRLEQQLVSRAASIFCSSEHLKKTLLERYGEECGRKTNVVRNGISANLLNECAPRSQPIRNESRTKVAYIGTVAEWMNFGVLLESLKRHQNIEFHLIGPVAVPEVPRHERLIFHGTIEHDRLPRLSEKFDAFMMPFVVTTLIESVDPVKLYEYVWYGRPIVSVYYDEIRRFGPWVHFYHDEEEFHSLMGRLVRGDLPLTGDHRCRWEFLEDNTWSRRCSEIRRQLDILL